MKTPRVSAVIPTRNRCDMLAETLASLMQQDFDPEAWEILVVDNGSTDATREKTESFAGRKPAVRYLHESVPGVSRARNLGIRESRGEYVVFFDDDILADPDCLRRLMVSLESDSAPAGVMGRVRLFWEGGERPKWILEEHDEIYSAYEKGDAPRLLSAREHVVGMNLAFRKEALLAAGGFREDVGAREDFFTYNEDVDVFRRVLDAGARIFYEPSAVIRHRVPPKRQGRIWLFKRLMGGATTECFLRLKGCTRVKLLHWLFYDLRVFLYYLALSAGDLFRARPVQIWKAASQLGRISAECQLLAGYREMKTLRGR